MIIEEFPKYQEGFAVTKPSEVLEPTWAIANLFPFQGTWSEAEYLALPTNRRVELSDGRLEVLPMPTMTHQWIVFFLCQALNQFAGLRGLGLALPAGLPVQLWAGKFREPDVVFMAAEHAARMHEQFWEGADLVVEVVSEDRRLDLEIKHQEYAQAHIPEYWIVDPREGTITVWSLQGDSYESHGEFVAGSQATSVLLPGFAVEVATLLAGPGGKE